MQRFFTGLSMTCMEQSFMIRCSEGWPGIKRIAAMAPSFTLMSGVAAPVGATKGDIRSSRYQINAVILLLLAQQVVSQSLAIRVGKLFGFFDVTLHQIRLFGPDNSF